MWRKIEPKSTFVKKKWQISGLNWPTVPPARPSDDDGGDGHDVEDDDGDDDNKDDA